MTCELPDLSSLSLSETDHTPKSSQTPNTYNRPYTYRSSGTNKDGNHYCSRDYGPDVKNKNSYHYSNTDGGYYYSNPDGSRYYNNGQGKSWYAPVPGVKYRKDDNIGKWVKDSGKGEVTISDHNYGDTRSQSPGLDAYIRPKLEYEERFSVENSHDSHTYTDGKVGADVDQNYSPEEERHETAHKYGGKAVGYDSCDTGGEQKGGEVGKEIYGGYGGGYADGHEHGYNNGYDVGYSDGYDDGFDGGLYNGY